MDVNIVVHDLLNSGVDGTPVPIKMFERVIEKALEDYVVKKDHLALEVRVENLETNSEDTASTLDYLREQCRTAAMNASTAQTTANDALAAVDSLTSHPPKDGASAFEIANSLRPEDEQFKNEQEWINYIEEVRADSLERILNGKWIYTDVKPLSVTIEPQDWHYCDDSTGGFTYVIKNINIKKNQDVDLSSTNVKDKALLRILAAATCDSMADGRFTIRIPKCDRPSVTIKLGFNLKEYVLEDVKA